MEQPLKPSLTPPRGITTGEEWHDWWQRRVSRRTFVRAAGAAGLVVAAGPILFSKPGFSAEPPRGIHLAYGTDPAREMTVSWFTRGSVGGAVLDVGTGTSYGRTMQAESVSYANPIDPPASVIHHVRIGGLAPGTTYHYRVRHNGGTSPDFTFETAPGSIVPFTFTSFGDHGSDPGTDAGKATWGTSYSPLAVQALLTIDPTFHMHNGDLSYSCAGPQEAWDVWQDEIQPRAATIPWMASLGNHEMEVPTFGAQGYDPWRARWRFPQNGVEPREGRSTTFYAFRYSNLLMIALDGNEASSENQYHFNRGYMQGKQDVWIDRTLAAARADPLIDWIAVSFHNCMYCTDVIHGSDGGCRARWQALFEKHHVDLVLNGHNHCYERTHPIKGAEFHQLAMGEAVDPTAMGVTYVCAGGGGQLSRTGSTYPTAIVHNEDREAEQETALWRAARYESYSVAVIAIDPGSAGGKTTLTLKAIEYSTPAMAEVDSIVFERPAKAVAAPTTPPKPAPEPAAEPRSLARSGGRDLTPVATGAVMLTAAAEIARALKAVD